MSHGYGPRSLLRLALRRHENMAVADEDLDGETDQLLMETDETQPSGSVRVSRLRSGSQPSSARGSAVCGWVLAGGMIGFAVVVVVQGISANSGQSWLQIASGDNAAAEFLLESSREGGSCEKYGCDDHFREHLSCQCNDDCHHFGNCCSDFEPFCQRHDSSNERNIKKLYHQTGKESGPQIIRYGFRPGRYGWCGGGIYFATSPEATFRKAIGPDSHKGFMIEATVDVGRVRQERGKKCGYWSRGRLKHQHYDSVTFNPGDGLEYVLFDKSRVLKTKRIPLHP